MNNGCDMKTLYDCLSEMKDFRRAQGQRIPLAAFLEMSVLAGMSGHFGINGMSRFIKNNESFFINRYNLQHGVPSMTTVYNIFKKLPFEEFSTVLRNWMHQFVESKSELWIAIDGKAIGSTLVNKYQNTQNFKTMVSMFSKEMGVVLDTVSMESKKANEGEAARKLISQFESKGMTFTLDALHCQKKRSVVSWSQEMTM